MTFTLSDELLENIKEYGGQKHIRYFIWDNLIEPLGSLVYANAYNPIIKESYEYLVNNLREERLKAFVMSKVFAIMDAKTTFDFKELLKDNYIQNILMKCAFRKFDFITHNAFLKRAIFEDLMVDEYYLMNLVRNRGDVDLININQENGLGVETPSILGYTERTTFPALFKGANIIDNVSPYYIYSTAEFISQARGKILIIGGKIGYLAYMTASLEHIESVTVLEDDAFKISMLQDTIFKNLAQRDKITVVDTDYESFINYLTDGEYHYIFVDNYTLNESFGKYANMKSILKRFKVSNVEYWSDSVFNNKILDMAFAYFLREVGRAQGQTDEPDVRVFNDLSDDIFIIQDVLDNIEIKEPSDIFKVFHNANIYKLIAEN